METTESKRIAELEAEIAALRKAEQLYSSIVGSTLDSAFALDRNGRFTFINPAAEKLTGYTLAEALTMSFDQVCAPEDLVKAHEAFQADLAGGHAELELTIITKDGRRLDLFFTGGPIIEHDQVTGIYGIAKDITAHKLAEAAIQDSEQKFLRLLGSMRDAFVSVDMLGRLRNWNRAYQEMLGYSDAELLGLTYIALTPSKWHAMEAKIVAEQILPLGHSQVYEKEYRRKDGTVLPVELRTFLVRAPDGQPSLMWAIVRDITERKQAENALRQSEERLQLAQSAGKMGTFDWDIVSGKVLWSSETERIWGLPAGGFEGTYEHWKRMVHPEDLHQAETYVQKAVAEAGTSYELEHRIVRPDGAVRWILAKATTIRNDSGQAVRMVGFNIDITERKQAEESLRQSEARFRQMAEAMPQIVWMTNADGSVGYLNQQWTNHTGLTTEQSRGTGWATVIHADDIPGLKAFMARITATGKPGEFEFRIRRAADGQYRWFLCRGLAVKDNEGRVTNLFGTSTDIDDQKQVEALLVRSEKELAQIVEDRTQALSDSEKRFRSLVEFLPVGVVVIQNRKFVFANNSAVKLYGGKKTSRLIGLDVSQAVPPDRHAKLLNDLQQQSSTPTFHEGAIRRLDGKRLDVIVGVAPFHFDGKPATVHVLRDITLQRQLEKEIINVSHREQQRIGRDLHDGVCQLLIGAELTCEAMRHRSKRKSAAVTQDELAYLQSVIKEAVRQTRVVTQGLIPVELETGGLATALQQLAKSTTDLFNIPCTVTGPRRFIAIHNPMAALQLYRIAQEAVHNAAKHAKPRHITIAFAAARSVITLTIADDGRGLAKSRRKKTGMGLQIMGYRARMINAEVTVQPNSPRGTIVTCSCLNRPPRVSHSSLTRRR